MNLNRREFLIMAAVAGSCSLNKAIANQGEARIVDAGLASSFSAEGVYAAFHQQGFFVVRRDGKLFALSSLCTHRASPLTAEPDRTFYCPRHGSTFSPSGQVTEGPAKRDLPVLGSSVNETGHFLVKVPQF